MYINASPDVIHTILTNMMQYRITPLISPQHPPSQVAASPPRHHTPLVFANPCNVLSAFQHLVQHIWLRTTCAVEHLRGALHRSILTQTTVVILPSLSLSPFPPLSFPSYLHLPVGCHQPCFSTPRCLRHLETATLHRRLIAGSSPPYRPTSSIRLTGVVLWVFAGVHKKHQTHNHKRPSRGDKCLDNLCREKV